MKSVKIFLASSAELKADRIAFESFLFQKTILWKKEKDIFLELTSWENFLDAMSYTRLQDEYNKAIKSCDIFVMLFWTKVGMYTAEEFDIAWQHFQSNGKPLVYTYFKSNSVDSVVEQSVEDFRIKLKKLGHFETRYESTEGLLLHFGTQLERIFASVKNEGKANMGSVKPDKIKINDLLNKSEIVEAFDELNKFYFGKNDKLNALMDEFINPPGTFSQAMFITRLKVFVSKI